MGGVEVEVELEENRRIVANQKRSERMHMITERKKKEKKKREREKKKEKRGVKRHVGLIFVLRALRNPLGALKSPILTWNSISISNSIPTPERPVTFTETESLTGNITIYISVASIHHTEK